VAAGGVWSAAGGASAARAAMVEIMDNNKTNKDWQVDGVFMGKMATQ
jgi:hypothetical protein